MDVRVMIGGRVKYISEHLAANQQYCMENGVTVMPTPVSPKGDKPSNDKAGHGRPAPQVNANQSESDSEVDDLRLKIEELEACLSEQIDENRTLREEIAGLLLRVEVAEPSVVANQPVQKKTRTRKQSTK